MTMAPRMVPSNSSNSLAIACTDLLGSSHTLANRSSKKSSVMRASLRRECFFLSKLLSLPMARFTLKMVALEHPTMLHMSLTECWAWSKTQISILFSYSMLSCSICAFCSQFSCGISKVASVKKVPERVLRDLWAEKNSLNLPRAVEKSCKVKKLDVY